MNGKDTPQAILLEDYSVPAFLIHTVDLFFDIEPGFTNVRAELAVERNPEAKGEEPLVLSGEHMELTAISLDEQPLADTQYRVDDKTLTLLNPPQCFTLTTEVKIDPDNNTALEGLYRSETMYCTQCEAEGFRRITYYLDRPDVMALFTATIEADQQQFPLLLSNGNKVSSEVLPNGRHKVVWQDPFKKPCYLFALVAGDLACLEDHYVTASGRTVSLQFFTEPHDIDKCHHAMTSLKNAMRWDEHVYGREYDLDIYMIVAVGHFNMGAMENKGLNIFNTSCVLASSETTTDMGFQRVEGVIAHEYFHNWSGNRVTCRDWFQLSLKEGFTVFRDSEFSADMNSRSVKRIEDVNVLRNFQFPEDAGPMSHPVRPPSYVEINNFYTMTIYEKGAEVVRMIRHLLGETLFRQGSDIYFEQNDGSAATIDDFVAAMAQVSGRDFSQFMRWYDQAGTPRIKVTSQFDPEDATYTLNFEQAGPTTTSEQDKKPWAIPVVVGLLDAAGEDLPLITAGQEHPLPTLEITQATQQVVFEGIEKEPVPSLLRGFSAPVILEYNYTDEQLAFLMVYDADGFNRWESSQNLALRVLRKLVKQFQQGEEGEDDAVYQQAVEQLLQNTKNDPALVAMALSLPGENYIADQMESADPGAIHQAREFLRHSLAKQLEQAWRDAYQRTSSSQPYQPVATEFARRALNGLALSYLVCLGGEINSLCEAQYQQANNMTDKSAALRAMVNQGLPAAEGLLADFYQQYQHEALVIDQWFSMQASNPQSGALQRVKVLMQRPDFELTNPNRARALIGAFCQQNPVHFHAIDGTGYEFLANQVLALDELNPQIAARLVSLFNRYHCYDATRQQLIREQLQRIADTESLSPNVYEIVKKALEG